MPTAGEPWTVNDLAAFMRCSPKTAARLDTPRVEVIVTGHARPLLYFDSEEVRAWWAEKVEAARQLRAVPGAGARVAVMAARPGTATTPTKAPRQRGAIVLECVDPSDVRRAG